MDYIAYQAPLSMGFSRQEYWSGLPFPSPGDLLYCIAQGTTFTILWQTLKKKKKLISPGFFRKCTEGTTWLHKVSPSCSSARSGSHFWCLAQSVSTKPIPTVTVAEASMHSPAACSPRAPTQVQGGGQWPVSKTTLSSCPSFPRTRCTQLTPVLLLPRRTLPRKPMPERSVSCNTPGLTLRHIFMSFTPRSSLVLFHCLLILRWGAFWESTVPSGQTYCTLISLWLLYFLGSSLLASGRVICTE